MNDLLSCFNLATMPEELPCRDEEIQRVREFVEGNLDAKTSGCMYISGVPGTGKTASIRLVMQQLQKRRRQLPDFVFVELNGMHVSDPKRIFVEFYKLLAQTKKFFTSGRRNTVRISPAAAKRALDHLFELSDTDRPAIVLLLDEIDAMVTKRQEHLYRLLDWSTKESAKLCVLAVANTLDFPERLLSNRNHSRMGLKRLCFKPYNHQQIEAILANRLRQFPDAVDQVAVQYTARKVAAVSGDIRRAFEICRMAVELAMASADEEGNGRPAKRRKSQHQPGETIKMSHVDAVLKTLAMNIKVQAIRRASTHEKLFLEAADDEHRRIGSDGTTFERIWIRYQEICQEEEREVEPLCVDELLDIANRLAECRLLIKLSSSKEGLQDFTARYRLNVNPGDVKLALQKF